MLEIPEPSEKLQAFLGEEDLDGLLRARHALGRLDDRDLDAVVGILEEWIEPQAVSNLLFYPLLIPQDRRMPCLLRALDEEEMVYYRLAATVGLQEDFPLTESERSAAADRLLKAIEDAAEVLREWEAVGEGTTFEEVFAARASAVIHRFVTVADGSRLAAQLDHPSDTVRQNVLRTLLDLVGRRETKRLVDEAVESGTVNSKTRRYVARRRDPMLLWAYIPNLRDLYRAEEGEVRRTAE